MCAFHQPRKVVRDLLVGDRGDERADDEVGGLDPANVAQHHAAVAAQGLALERLHDLLVDPSGAQAGAHLSTSHVLGRPGRGPASPLPSCDSVH